MRFKKAIVATVAAMAFGAFASAQAAPVLVLSNGATTISCADGTLCDLNPFAGVVTYIGAVGSFVVNVSTGLGDIASPTNLIDLNSVNVGLGGGTLTIGFSDTGYTHQGVIFGSWAGTFSALNGSGSVSAAAWAGTDNALFSQDYALGSLGPFGGPVFASTFSTLAPSVGPYSLTQLITIDVRGDGATYSGDFELKIPEPSALALVGVGLLGLGAARRRKPT